MARLVGREALESCEPGEGEHMTRVTVVVREAGGLDPDYALNFELPEVPQVGSYISIHRPDTPEPLGEDLIVKQVWWRLHHPETRGSHPVDETGLGKAVEIFVECAPAIGPWSSKEWRKSLAHAEESGLVEQFQVARLSVPIE